MIHDTNLLNNLSQTINFRNLRAFLLRDSDHTQLVDSPVSKKEEWAVYRQQLRDMTLQENFPFTIVWPTQP